MDDIVAVRVRLDTKVDRYFLTWGRLFDAVDPKPVAHVVLSNAARFALGGRPVEAGVCWSLQEASNAPYFYESFFDLCQRGIPFGPDYAKWRRETLNRMIAGDELWYLGGAQSESAWQPDARVDDGYVMPVFEHEPPAPFRSALALSVTPWAEDELQCHRWEWRDGSWTPTEATSTRTCGDEEMVPIGSIHYFCQACGWTYEIEPDSVEGPDPAPSSP